MVPEGVHDQHLLYTLLPKDVNRPHQDLTQQRDSERGLRTWGVVAVAVVNVGQCWSMVVVVVEVVVVMVVVVVVAVVVAVVLPAPASPSTRRARSRTLRR